MGRQHPVSGPEAVAYILKVANLSKRAEEIQPKDRSHIAKKNFAQPSKEEAGHKGKYPITDRQHAKSALGFAKMHGDTAALAAVKRKVEQKYPDMLDHEKDGCLKVATIEAIFDELAKIAGPPPIPAAALRSPIKAALRTATPQGLKALNAVPLPKGPPPISGMAKGADLEKEEGLFGKMFGSGAGKVAPKLMGGGVGGASALRAVEKGGWNTVGVGRGASSYVGQASKARPIGSLQQNIAERGISL